MSACITEDELKEIIDWNSAIPLSPFILTAETLFERVEKADTDSCLTDASKKQVKLYLAAHFYSVRDPQYKTRKTADASGTVRGSDGNKFDSSTYGQTAMMLDCTGFLSSLNRGNSGKKYGAVHSAKPYSASNGNIHESY